jgi:hypothetical protein
MNLQSRQPSRSCAAQVFLLAEVAPQSLAEELELAKGDRIVRLTGVLCVITSIFDFNGRRN